MKELARTLRKKGLSYKEILKHVPVAKSTISLWVRDVPLTKAQHEKIWEGRENKLSGIKAIQTEFWHKRCAAFYQGVEMAKKINDDNFVAGLMLYWAEGTKVEAAAISNSDPGVIKFMVKWFASFYNITPQHLTIHLHLHTGQNEKNMKKYWSKVTRVPISNFQKSFIKPEGSGYRKNILYNGTVKLRIRCKGSTYLLFKILGGIAGFLEKTINEKPVAEKWMSRSPYAKDLGR